MSQPYAVSTYSPMSAPQQQDPYMNAYNGNSFNTRGGQANPAQLSMLGTQATPQQFAQRDQSFLPGLVNDFSDQEQWGLKHNGDTIEYGKGYHGGFLQNHNLYNTTFTGENHGGPFSGNKNVEYSYSGLAPIEQLKTHDQFNSFAEAQDYYRNYFNTVKGLENSIPQIQQTMLRGMGDAHRSAYGNPGVGSMFGQQYQQQDMAPWLTDTMNAYKDMLGQRTQSALKQYLDLYNAYGNRGAFGANFQTRTAPFTLDYGGF